MRILAFAVLMTMVLAGCGDKDPAPVTEEVPSGNAISGVVVTPAIKPIPGVTVVLTPSDAEDTTDLFGRFRFDALEPGTYVVQASAIDHETARTTVQVVEGETARPRIVLTPLAPPAPRHETHTYVGNFPGSFGPVDEQAEPYKEQAGIDPCTCSWIVNIPRYTVAVTLEIEWENQYAAPDPGPKPQMTWTMAPSSLSHTANGTGPTPIWNVLTEESFGDGFTFAEAPTMSIKVAPDEVYPITDQTFRVYLTPWEVDMPPDGWGITNGDQ